MSATETTIEAAGTRRPWRRWSRFAPAILAAVLGVWATIAVFLAVDRGDEQRVAGELQVRAEWRARGVEIELYRVSVPVATMAAHLSAIEDIDQSGFETFARQAATSGIPMSSMAWRPLVAAADRGDFIRGVRQKHYPSFEIVEPRPAPGLADRPEPGDEFPVLHETRFDGRPVLRGIALRWDPRLWKAAMEARDEGQPRTTLPLRPLGVESGDTAIVLVWPVYRGGHVPASIAQRREALRGFVTAVYPVRAVLGIVMRQPPSPIENIRFFVTQVEQDGEYTATEVASYVATEQTVGPALEIAGQLAPGAMRIHRTISVHGQVWQLLLTYPAAVVDDLRSSSRWGWLAGMLLATLAVVYYLVEERSRRGAVEHLVAERTAALSAAYGDLQRESRDRESAQRALLETGETLRALVDGSAHAVVAVAPDRSIMLWNKAAETIFGYGAADVVGKLFPMTVSSGQAAFDALFANACAGQVESNVRFACLRRDGTPVEVRCGGAPFYDGAGKLRGVAYMLEDVTEQLATEAMLRQSQKMEAIGTLTGGLAHDFNNLLTIVTLNLETILDLESDPALRERADRALTAAERGGELTRQLLTFARKQPLQPRAVDLNKLLAGTVKLLDRTLGEQVVLRFEPAASLPSIVIDGAQLDSAIVNLAVNARDAMPGGGLLTLKTQLVELHRPEIAQPADVPAGRYAVVELADTGSGMSPEVLKRIFEPFFTTKGPGKGTGLGLSMVFGFVRQSHGYTTVRSVEGRGTTFRLYLPLGDAVASAATGDAPATTAPTKGGSQKILVVDDNDQIRKVIVSQLATMGYRPIEVSSPMEALRLIDSDDDIDLLFTDIIMPGGMNGYELARAARARRPGLAVLTSSGFPGDEAAADDPEAASLPMLPKPYRREKLAAAVADALTQKPHAAPAEPVAG
ncbi:MAG: CHASE domain-containing protein [Alphaproteobacteria bacterium]|nr:CHASE domain-containing protein [Alphaproteobacteria bacterium]